MIFLSSFIVSKIKNILIILVSEITFLHTKFTGGVLTELCEKK